MAKRAKSLRYWNKQFDESLPVFLAEWYVTATLPEIVELCEKEGVQSLVKYTGGFYSSEQVGEWIVWHTHALDGLIDQVQISRDPIVANLFSRIKFHPQVNVTTSTLKRLKSSFYRLHMGWPAKIAEALISTCGQMIQSTKWWEESIQEIRKQSRAILAVKKVMES